MRLPDVNVLLYAVNRTSAEHHVAKNWLEAAINDPLGIGLPWVVILGFIRLSTRRAILSKPLSTEDALEVVSEWVSHPATRIIEPTERHLQILGRLLLSAGAAGNLTTDAHLAAVAIEHGATLASFDRDFERFSGLNFENLSA